MIAEDDEKHLLVGPGSDCVQDNLNNMVDIILGNAKAREQNFLIRSCVLKKSVCLKLEIFNRNENDDQCTITESLIPFLY